MEVVLVECCCCGDGAVSVVEVVLVECCCCGGDADRMLLWR